MQLTQTSSRYRWLCLFCVYLLCVVTAGGNYQHLLVETRGEKSNIGLIQLNRPKALNALCNALMEELRQVLDDFEKDREISCAVLTGSEKAFAGLK